MAGEIGETGGHIFQGWNNSATDTALPVSFGWATQVTQELKSPHFEANIKYSKTIEGIHPQLYFRYLKSKFSMIETEFFKRRMKQLEKMVDEYAELGQEALSDECIRQFYIMGRESAMWACGIKIFVTHEQIEKFRYKVRGCNLKVTPIKNFARVIPENAARQIKFCMEKKLFDEYVIVHIDSNDWRKSAVKETDKERVKREKDPICFGRIRESDKYYFVSDWVDEMDTLRLDDIIKALSLKKKDMKMKYKMDRPEIKKKK